MTDSDQVDPKLVIRQHAKHGRTVRQVDTRIGASDHMTLRIEEPLERLLAGGYIDGALYAAGDWFRKRYETAHAGGSCMNYDGSPPPDSYGSRTQPEVAMEAVADVNWAQAALGVVASAHLVSVVCEARSIEDHCERWPVPIGYARARSEVVAALGMLADRYGVRGSAKRNA